jgi:hypothetical protein
MRVSQTGTGGDSADRFDNKSFSDDSDYGEEADTRNTRHRTFSTKPDNEKSLSSNSRSSPRERSVDTGSSRRRAQTDNDDSLHGRDRSSSSSKRKLVSTICSSTVDNDKPVTKDRSSMDAITIAKQRRAARKEDTLGPSRHRADRLRGSSHGPSSQHRSAAGIDVAPVMPTRHNPNQSSSNEGSNSCHGRLTQRLSDPLGGSSHSKSSRLNRSDPLSVSAHSVRHSATSHSPRRASRREDTVSGTVRHGTRRSHPSTPVSSERLHNLTMLMGDTAGSPKPEQTANSLDAEEDEALGELLTSSEMTPKELRKILDSRKKADEKKRMCLHTESSTHEDNDDLQPCSPDGVNKVFKSPLPQVSNKRMDGIQSARKERKNTLVAGRPPFSPTLTCEKRSTSMIEVNHLTPPRVPSEGFQRSMSLDTGNKECEFKATPKIRHLNNKYVGRKIEAKHAHDRQQRRSSVKTSLFSMLDEQEDLFDFTVR